MPGVGGGLSGKRGDWTSGMECWQSHSSHRPEDAPSSLAMKKPVLSLGGSAASESSFWEEECYLWTCNLSSGVISQRPKPFKGELLQGALK